MGKMPETIDYTVSAKGGVQEVASKLDSKLKEKGYGILSTIDVQKILLEKNNHKIEPYLILDVCNPSHAGKAMELHRGVGLVLPCKISVYEENSVTKISLLKPTTAIGLTGYDDLGNLASGVEDELQQTIKSIND